MSTFKAATKTQKSGEEESTSQELSFTIWRRWEPVVEKKW